MESLIFDSYSVLTTEIAHGLTEENIKTIKFLIRGDIGKGVLEKVLAGRDLVRLLEERCWLSPEKVDSLSSLLQICGRNDLDKKVQQYVIAAVSRILSNHDYYGLQGMHVREDFVETSEYKKLCEHMKNNNIAILKGIPGTWKSQYAFNYSHHFVKDHNQETTSLIWRVNCNTELNIYNSFSHLMNYFKIQCVNTEHQLEKSVLQMLSRATEFLSRENYAKEKHLFILVGFESPQIRLIEQILKHLRSCRGISVIATTTEWPLGEFEGSVIEIQGMTEDEAVHFLSIYEESSIDFAKQLAKKLSYLPDGLVFAKRYMATTNTSIERYLSILQSLKSGVSDENNSAAEACLMVIQQAEGKMSNEERKLLQYLPYMNTQNIPVFILKALLPDSLVDDAKELLINNFLLTLRNHSLISIKGEDDSRVITAHFFTLMTLKASKNLEERRGYEQTLLEFYMSYMELDARLLEVIHRNVLLLDHAESLLNSLDALKANDHDTIAMICYLNCVLGITYRLYGNTELSAELFFKQAKKLMYVQLSKCKEFVLQEEIPPKSLAEYLDGHESVVEHANIVFTGLLGLGQKLTTRFIENFLESKYRTKRDINLLHSYGDIDINSVNNGKLPGHVIDHLRDQNLTMNTKHISETFLIELMIRIFYNSSKNTWLKELSKEEYLFSRESETEGRKLRSQASSTYLPVTTESILEHQIAHNLTKRLKNYMDDIELSTKQNGIHTFCPVFSSVTKRSAVLYMLRSVDDPKILPKLLHESIKMLEDLDKDILGIGFIEFGVVKRIGDSSLFHIMMIDRILMECYERLYKLGGKTDDLSKAVEISAKIEKQIHEMTAWKALSGIHLKIAKVLRLSGTPENIKKSKHHYIKAYEREYESNNTRLTRFHLKAVVNYADCCLQYPKKEELEIAKSLSIDMKNRFHLKETDEKFDELIKKIEDKITKISTKSQCSCEPLINSAIQTDEKMTQTENKYVALRIANLETRKEGLEKELELVKKELDDLKAVHFQ